MKIFISWSGNKSKAIGAVFKEWIPGVIQAVKPYYSSSDIDKGARWSNEIAAELEASKIGLIILTNENLEAPWLMFEAGALSKSLDKARVCPMLFGIEPTDLSGPLVQFQAAVFSKDEVLKVMKTINSQLGDAALESNVLDSVFEKWWPDLETKITAIIAKSSNTNKESRSDRDLLEEVLSITRSIYITEREKIGSSKNSRFTSTRSWQEFTERYFDLINEIIRRLEDPNFLIDINSQFIAITKLLLRWAPDELSDRFHLRYESTIDTMQSKINELIETPF